MALKSRTLPKDIQIVVSGTPGSGKSTIAKYLAKSFSLQHFSAGDYARQLARGRGVSLLELSAQAQKSPLIDTEIDNFTRSLAKKKKVVIDSRIGWHFLPKAISVLVTVDEKESAKRIFNQHRATEKENVSFQKTLRNIKKRKASERLRYKKYYHLDIDDLCHYDIIIDTTGYTAPEMERIAKEAMLLFLNGRESSLLGSRSEALK